MTPYQAHCKKWENGCGSGLCKAAKKVVICRGTLPCEILFIGEAPGESEDVLGRPFIGPAGHLLDRIIREALPGHTEIGADGSTEHWMVDIPIAFTNLVGCIPRDEEGGKATEPPREAIKQCFPRLRELVIMAKPRLVVLVGKLAKQTIHGQAQFSEDLRNYTLPWIPEGEFLNFVDIIHPAAILRANPASRGLLVQKAIVALQNAAEFLSSD